jgi:serine-type D-Ala-D-Ala carboxypeptidase
MTAPVEVPGGIRSRGWDMATSYSAPRGDGFPKGESFGHTGFTGTSIWIDPKTQTAVIVLTNRVHISEKVQVTKLRREVATIVAGLVK